MKTIRKISLKKLNEFAGRLENRLQGTENPVHRYTILKRQRRVFDEFLRRWGL